MLIFKRIKYFNKILVINYLKKFICVDLKTFKKYFFVFYTIKFAFYILMYFVCLNESLEGGMSFK